MANLSVQQFASQLQDEIRAICEENGWKYKSPTYKGTAFGIWCARLISEQDARYDTDPIDAYMDGPRDLGIDIVFFNADADELLICQCKYLGSKKGLDEKVLTDFLGLHDKLLMPGYIKKYGHANLVDALPVSAMEKHPDRIIYRLITNATITNRSREVWKGRQVHISGPTYELWTRDDLKRYCVEVDSYDDESIDDVKLELPSDQYIHFLYPRATLVAVVSTNGLKNLWDKHHGALYAENIRGGLRSKLNTEMRETLESQPADFFLL